MDHRALKAAFDRGENIAALLRRELDLDHNSETIIELAYDLQAGSYTRMLEDPAIYARKERLTHALAELLRSLGPAQSVLEGGAGEGSTLRLLLETPGCEHLAAYGMDLSWSRMAVARSVLEQAGHPDTQFAAASLLALPYPDDAFDVVFTSHSIEPNRGKEAEIIAELHRVTARYLILLEPAYELVTDAVRARMDEHGYCRDIPGHCTQLNLNVRKHGFFAETEATRNPTALTLVEKDADAAAVGPKLVCPRYGSPLEVHGNALFAAESGFAYPVLGHIPCLRPDDAIVASHLPELT